MQINKEYFSSWLKVEFIYVDGKHRKEASKNIVDRKETKAKEYFTLANGDSIFLGVTEIKDKSAATQKDAISGYFKKNKVDTSKIKCFGSDGEDANMGIKVGLARFLF